jgi:hypothetical protein
MTAIGHKEDLATSGQWIPECIIIVQAMGMMVWMALLACVLW